MSAVRCPVDGKLGYVTEDDARRALRKAQGAARRLRKGRVRQIARQERRYYYHDECGRWHLTSAKAIRNV